MISGTAVIRSSSLRLSTKQTVIPTAYRWAMTGMAHISIIMTPPKV